jgi:hypothetical protein
MDDDGESDLTAVHESGHAVIAHVLGHPVLSVSLIDRLVRTRYRRGDPAAHWRELLICLAGPAAEQRYDRTNFPFWIGPYGTDLDNARRHIEACGFAEWRDDAEQCARILVRENWRRITRVARELQARGTLTGDELSGIMFRTDANHT